MIQQQGDISESGIIPKGPWSRALEEDPVEDVVKTGVHTSPEASCH